mgnify:CR=1 FL=1
MFKILPTALFRKSVTSLAASLTFLPRMRNFKGIIIILNDLHKEKTKKKRKENETKQTNL